MPDGVLTYSSTQEGMPPKKRRATKAEVQARRAAVYAIVAEMHPMTVRQAYYQAVVRGIVEKTDGGYDRVDADTCKMRRSGEMPFEWIVDLTRSVLKPLTFGSVGEALLDVAENYRKDLWCELDCRVQIWIEKRAVIGAVEPVTNYYDVPLFPAGGYSSITFLHDAAKEIARFISEDVPTYVYQFGDYDPSGENASECIERDLRGMSGAELHFERVALTEEQVRRWRLPTRPTKQSDTRARRFGSSVSVELDALDPNTLRSLVREVIERHLPPRLLRRLKKAEEAERERIARLVDSIRDEKAS